MISYSRYMPDLVCPLCGCSHTEPYWQDKNREYVQCGCCDLVFVPTAWHLSAADEKACYDLHDNQIDDQGYRRFLSRILEPVIARVSPDAKGLDFGCGPGPALASMFREQGYSMALYDIFYANNPDVLQHQYDFITCTEVVEHLSRPGEVLDQLLAMLKPGGWLGVMTKLVLDQEAFSRWHYIRDPTHISFFSRLTFSWFAQQRGCELVYVGADVILLRKQRS